MTREALGLVTGEDGRRRCWWVGEHADYAEYHDIEWGRYGSEDHQLFEKLALEGFQSGLSWLTILRKRENFRTAFAGFEIERVARFNRRSIDRLLADAGIVRHRGKIEATINNARCALEIVREFGSLAQFFEGYQPPAAERPTEMTYETLRKLASTPTSERLSRELKGRGFRFVGPTTLYAFMQSVGLVNDHVAGCWCRAECGNRRGSQSKV